MARTKRNYLAIGAGIFIVLLIIAIIVGLIVYFSKQQSSSSGSNNNNNAGTTAPPVIVPTTTKAPNVVVTTTVAPVATTTFAPITTGAPTQPPNSLPIGSACKQLNECATGSFCNGSGICQSGNGTAFGQQCISTNQCLFGTFCNAKNVCFRNPVGNGDIGQPCTANENCRAGTVCDTNTWKCKAPPPVTTTHAPTSPGGGSIVPTATPTPAPVLCPAGSRVPIYRLNCGVYQLYDTTAPPAGAIFYPATQTTPIWYGCNSGGPGRIPLYSWVNNTSGNRLYPGSTSRCNDRVFSLTSAYPDIFPAGDLRRSAPFGGYTLENNGAPVCYIYQSRIDDSLLPLYRFQESTKFFHTTATQPNTIASPSWEGSGIQYRSLGQIGYVFVT